MFFNSDSVFIQYAQSGFLDAIDNLYYYYDRFAQYMTPYKIKKEVGKMRDIAKQYNSKPLEYESDYMQAVYLPDHSEKDFNYKVDQIEKIIESASERGDAVMKLRGIEALFDLYWKSMMFAKAFHQIKLLDAELENISDIQYPGKEFAYCQIGKAYYFFRDYDKAIEYLRKALKPSRHYFDASNLEARNMIGSYYHIKEEADSAEYYFRSALFSPDKVMNRASHDAVSFINLGMSLAKKKMYTEAISYFEPGLSRMLIDHNYESASKIYIDMGNCYLAKGDLSKAKSLIDSAIVYIKWSGSEDHYQDLYTLMSKYYLKRSNMPLAESYLDSTIMASRAYEKKYSGLNILRAEQQLFDIARKASDDEMKQRESSYESKLYFSLAFIVLVSLCLIFFIYLYRKKKNAFQALVQKNQDWAEAHVPVYEDKPEEIKEEGQEEEVNNGPQEEDREIVKQVHEYLIKDKRFKNLDLTLDLLAKDLNVNRNYLSKAINKTTGKNFNTFINEYRVKESIKIMSDSKMDVMSIDAIALEVGFGNRISFYQSFKKITGLSPSDFRNNKK